MLADVKCPKCGGLATERKSRSKGAKDRYRCFGKKWSKEIYDNGVIKSVLMGYTESCGLFGVKDITQDDKQTKAKDSHSCS